MDDLWNKEGRVKPTALDYEGIMSGSFPTPPLRAAPAAAASAPAANGSAAPEPKSNSSAPSANGNSAQLRDQRELSLKENVELLIDR
jgi:ubiquitin-like 1-activating enzyme E1 B